MAIPDSSASGSFIQRIGLALGNVSAVARGGFALVLGTLIASGMGMIFWAIAARLLSPEEFGIGAALITALTTLSHASQLNLRNLLHRFVPSSGADASKLIYRSYGVAAAVAVVLGTGFAVLTPRISPEIAFLGQTPIAVAGFAAALLIWTLYALQEAALTALRLASYVPVQSLVNAVIKIALLVVLALLLANWSSIFISWIVAALIVGVFTHVTTSRGTLAQRTLAGKIEPIGWDKIASFFGWDYVGALATSISLGVTPLVIVSMVGAAEAAPYFIAWSLSYLLYLVARHTGSAMLAELAANEHRRAPLYAEAIVLTLIPVTCGTFLLLLFAPLILMIFGPHYVEAGVGILRVLAISSIPGSLVAVFLAICRAENWGKLIALLQVTTLVAVVAIGAPLVSVLGPIGMAWGWLAAHTLAAILALVLTLARHGRIGAFDFALDLVYAARRLVRQFMHLLPRRNALPLNGELSLAGRVWRFNGPTPKSLSDASTQRLISADDRHELAVLKRAVTDAGRHVLQREHAALLQLRKDPVAAQTLGQLIPEPLFYEEQDAVASLLLGQLPGLDVRSIKDRAELEPALASIVSRMQAFHDAGSAPSRPTGSWVAEWIDAPLARLSAAIGDHTGLRKIGDELHSYWAANEHQFGAGHGDFTPDNLLIQKNAESGQLEPSGLVDWGGFRGDAPAGIDACTMALTMRCHESGRQLGQVVLDLLGRPVWTENELQWLRSAGLQPWLADAAALRAIVLLAWLQHIDSNLGKSARYSGRGYWALANIRLVVEGVAHA